MPRVVVDFRVQEGGVGRYGRDLLDALRRIGHAPELQVVARGRSLADRLLLAPYTPWGRAAVGAAAKRWHADAIHGLHLEVPPAAVPRIVTIHDVIPLEHPASMPNPLRRRLFRWLVQRSLEVAAAIIVPSERTGEALLRVGAQKEKVWVIPLGVSDAFRPIATDEKAAARQRFAGGKRYVACIYHPKPHKNLSAFVDAAALLHRDDTVFVCAGKAEVAMRPVRFTGVLSDDDLRMFYGGAEAFVLPSIVEGFGLPALEAIACGVPVVCGPGAGALPYIREAAEVVDVTFPEQIAAGLGRLLDDHQRREELAARATSVAERLSVDATARATLEVYEAVLARRAESVW